MVMYHYQPKQEYECDKIAREDRRHQMDEHLTHSMRSLLEDEVIPQIENELNFDPTPQY
jgi:hypothetical protein